MSFSLALTVPRIPDPAKLSPCGCAGIYTAPNTMACLAQVFEQENALDRLEDFTSLHGAAFYGVAPNAGYHYIDAR